MNKIELIQINIKFFMIFKRLFDIVASFCKSTLWTCKIEYDDNEKLLQDTDVAERAVCLLMDMAQRYVGIRSWLWQ